MLNKLILGALCAFVWSCGTIVDPPTTNYYDYERITSVDWFSGDSLVAATVLVPADGSDQASFLRIYDLQGNVRDEFPLTNVTYPSDLHIAKNNRQAILDGSGSIHLIDIANKTSRLMATGSRIISNAPDRDAYIIFRSMDNTAFGPYEVFALTGFGNDTLLVTKTVSMLTGFSFQATFPLYLSGGRIATIDFDSLNSQVMSIKDSSMSLLYRYHTPVGLRMIYTVAPSRDSNFFFLSSNGSKYDVCKFITVDGVVDVLHTISSYSDIAVTSDGSKVIYEQSSPGLVIRDIKSGNETSIPGSENASGFYLSHDDTRLAVIKRNSGENDKLVVVSIP
jgi:hypothetical protein